MNFNVELVLSSGGRIGRIVQIAHGRTVTLDTPMCTLFTRGGSPPYLSLSMLGKVRNVPELATMSINSFVEHIDSFQGSGKRLSEFTSMKDKLVFSSLHDASLPLQSGKNDKTGIAVWGKGGKTLLDPSLYMKVQEMLQPDWLLALSDGDTDHESTEKRAGKAVDRTLDFLDEIVSAQEKSEVLKESTLIGAVVGGYSDRHRQRSAKETAARPVQGFLLEGFQKGYTHPDKTSDEQLFQKILTKTISHLPEDKPRLMETPWCPLKVIQAVKLGIDVFSSAYPHTLAEKGFAMGQDFSLPAKCSTNDLGTDTDSSCQSLQTPPVIDLNEKRFFDDFKPVLEGCQCYTCVTFTRSYIHHLLNTSELLGRVLLTIHNFERYFLFFHALRESMKDGRLADLEDKLLKQQTVTETETQIKTDKD